jgi:hypothetical protein
MLMDANALYLLVMPEEDPEQADRVRRVFERADEPLVTN